MIQGQKVNTHVTLKCLTQELPPFALLSAMYENAYFKKVHC